MVDGQNTDSPSGQKIVSFTPQTCLELIDKLTEAQLKREVQNIDNKALTTRARKLTKTDKTDTLKKYYKDILLKSHDEQTDSIQSIITIFTRHIKTADEKVVELQAKIEDAQRQIPSLSTSTEQSSVPSCPLLTFGTADEVEQTGTFVEPFTKHPGSPLSQFDVGLLDRDTVYGRVFSNRAVAYYGDTTYKYPGGSHPPRSIKDNPYLVKIAAKVSAIFPDIRFNSALLTKYDKPTDCLPPHSDNEISIDKNSTIITVSLGHTRQLHFRRKPPGEYKRHVLEVNHGEVFLMTRESQDYYDHGVPQTDSADPGTRISITFRFLVQPDKQERQTAPVSATQTNTLRKVLILSDSKNRSFNCSQFREPVVCFREDMYYLRDIDRHSAQIRQADVVLISAGINDLLHNRADPRTIHDHMLNFSRRATRQYPNTTFLFDAVTPLAMHADRFNRTNDRIDEMNRLILHLSLNSQNIKLFDTLRFGLPHLARDGVHLNDGGKAVISECWVNVILITLGLRRANLPLRHSFLSIVDRGIR